VRGIPIYAISQVLDKIITGRCSGPSLLINGVKRPMPLIRLLEAELYPTLLSKARSFGLPDAWVKVITLFFYFKRERKHFQYSGV
jgi:pro-apoptotic serine protease NMA111